MNIQEYFLYLQKEIPGDYMLTITFHPFDKFYNIEICWDEFPRFSYMNKVPLSIFEEDRCAVKAYFDNFIYVLKEFYKLEQAEKSQPL